ncbi:MAG: hypothetical protein ACI4M6_05490 [Christensenellaceae bacterium]
MGLKTTNYEIKKLGIVVPEAYAIIQNIEIHGSKGKAEFIIQSTRETTKTKQPLEKFYIDFSINRNENPYITAYNTAKGTYKKIVKTKFEDEETGRIKLKNIEQDVPNRLHGWEDDIINYSQIESETKFDNA